MDGLGQGSLRDRSQNASAVGSQGSYASLSGLTVACPLCGHERVRPSWFGGAAYEGRVFAYAECLGCRSHFCDPMPGAQTVARMYGPEYRSVFPLHDPGADLGASRGAARWLRTLEPGTLVDYGCGSGRFMVEVARLGWTVVGVEFDREVAQRVAERTGIPVFTAPTDLAGLCADALHLGDVVEHLTPPDPEMKRILRLLKPRGLLLAEGPLEAEPSLFTWGLRLVRLFRGHRPVPMAPYHVVLATAMGQRLFFRRHGFVEHEYTCEEAAWPAPERVTLADITQPRRLALYGLRRLSQFVTLLGGRRSGNRYFYVGRLGD